MPVPLRAEDGFELDPARVAAAITPRTKMIVLNSPANPTGGVLGRAALEQLAQLAVEHGLVVLSDEIYGRILYDGAEHVSIATLPGHGGADGHPRRLLQDVRDDRLAPGLRGLAGVARRRTSRG